MNTKTNPYIELDKEEIKFLLENPSEIETGDEMLHEDVEEYHIRKLKEAYSNKLDKDNE